DMMHGRVDVKSEYGKGSTFTVTIPQAIVSDEPIGNFKEKFEKSLEEKKDYHESFRAPSAKVLIVDDTRMNLIVIENLLKKTGIVIDTAISGEDSIELAKKNSYDVILMDQRMTGMDGTEAMGQIREIENRKYEKVPVICLTADVVRGARDKYLKMGFDNYLTKPVDSAELEKMLLAYIPKDKIRGKQKSDKDAGENKEPSLKELGKILGKDGIDVKTGLSYCGSDEELYRSLLYAYVKEEKDKAACLNKAFAEKDWKNYGVYVHSLKSTSRMIGAVDLSEKAADLERAANDYNADVINARHDSLMTEYAALAKAVRDNTRALDSGAEETQSNDTLEEDGIMEFLPEEN
ncbi:MAG: response regulator, partial [Lachnospiraceae bacterium]|nr:response regulator [Lachnospiraceae bacterium]